MSVEIITLPKWVCEIHIKKKNKINNSVYDETSIVEIYQIQRGKNGETPDHEWIGTALRFKKPDRTWGDVVELSKQTVIKSVETLDEATEKNSLYFVGEDNKDVFIVDENGNKIKQIIGKQYRFFDSSGKEIG